MVFLKFYFWSLPRLKFSRFASKIDNCRSPLTWLTISILKKRGIVFVNQQKCSEQEWLFLLRIQIHIRFLRTRRENSDCQRKTLELEKNTQQPIKVTRIPRYNYVSGGTISVQHFCQPDLWESSRLFLTVSFTLEALIWHALGSGAAASPKNNRLSSLCLNSLAFSFKTSNAWHVPTKEAASKNNFLWI